MLPVVEIVIVRREAFDVRFVGEAPDL